MALRTRLDRNGGEVKGMRTGRPARWLARDLVRGDLCLGERCDEKNPCLFCRRDRAARIARPAVADSFVIPDAVTPWVFEGGGTFSRGATLTCDATIELSGNNDSADTPTPFAHSEVSGLTATITASGGLFGICASAVIAPITAGNITYSPTSNTTGILVFSNVNAVFFGHACTGTIIALWDEATQALTVSGSLLNGCSMNVDVNPVSPRFGDIVSVGDGNHPGNHP